MARKRQNKVSEENLQKLIENWGNNDIKELASMLDTDEASVVYWAAQLRKSMKKQGMSNEQIKKLLPTKRKVQPNVYDAVVSKLVSGKPAKKKDGRRKKTAG